MLFNHVTAPLSELEQQMVEAVPEGGNWQQIPSGLSQRVDQIRERSLTRGLIHTTYYGRLRWDAPSYTISTFFSRSGNGCFIHPEQHRLISAREAARLQSFPDSFVFTGTNRAVAAQIGNAVPPLLGLCVGKILPGETVVDLFAGAGGLSYGLELSGKKLLYGIELDRHAAATFQSNHSQAIVRQLDLGTEAALSELTSDVASLGGCDILVGGPPCQSFSTAGNRAADARSSLVYSFVSSVKLLRPEVVVMENVLGLRSFKGGKVLQTLTRELSRLGYHVNVWDLTTDRYAIPQRRRRLLVVGSRTSIIEPPCPITPAFKNGDTATVSVRDAIADLPPLRSGGGDSPVSVRLPKPKGPYQAFVRGLLSGDEYLRLISHRSATTEQRQLTLI